MKFEESDIGKEYKLYDDNVIKSYKLKAILGKDKDTYLFENPQDSTDIYYLFEDSDDFLVKEEQAAPTPAIRGGRRSRKTKKEKTSKKQRKTRRRIA